MTVVAMGSPLGLWQQTDDEAHSREGRQLAGSMTGAATAALRRKPCAGRPFMRALRASRGRNAPGKAARVGHSGSGIEMRQPGFHRFDPRDQGIDTLAGKELARNVLRHAVERAAPA
jgi:hypothetical protein